MDLLAQPAFLIPFTPSVDREDTFGKPAEAEDGYRWEVYEANWHDYLRRLQESAALIKEHSMNSYKAVEAGIRHKGLQVIATTGASYAELLSLLSSTFHEIPCVSWLSPIDCSSVSSAVQALARGFIPRNRDHILSSSSSYTLDALEAWFTAIPDEKPRLITVIREFEKFPVEVLEDLWYMLSRRAAQIPILFVISTVADSDVTAYIRRNYKAQTLSFIHLIEHSVSTTTQLLLEVMLKTFLDEEFDSRGVVDPPTFAFAFNYISRYVCDYTSLVTIFQLAHLKYYFGLVAVHRDTQKSPGTRGHLDGLGVHLASTIHFWTLETISSLAAYCDVKRDTAKQCTADRRLAFKLVIFLEALFYRRHRFEIPRTSWLIRCLSGQANLVADEIDRILSRLSLNDMQVVVGESRAYLQLLTSEHHIEVPQLVSSSSHSPIGSSTLQEFREWLVHYVRQHLNLRLRHSHPTDTFPHELLNPSLGACVPFALLQPSQYVSGARQPSSPDTSTVFHRYVESGKLVNLYDWYQSFISTSNTANEAKDGHQSQKTASRPPVVETQARFMRALKELAYLGFVKPSGRRPGHVQKTFFHNAA